MDKMMDPVVILGLHYDVVYVDREHDGMSDKVGLAEPDHTRLLITRGYSAEAERETVLHEVLHILDIAMRVGLSEKQVSVLARGLLCVLTQNPHLTKKILGE